MFYPTVLLICGLLNCISAASVKPEGKIVGGAATNIAVVPYQVSLQYNGRHFCGGTILNARIIITAAHCVNTKIPTQIQIRYGSSYWSSGGTLIGVSTALVHPNFVTSTMEYDMALLKTDRPIVWSTNVLAVNLAQQEIAGGTQAVISGWGTLRPGATTIPDVLQSAYVSLIERSVCQSGLYGYSTSVGSTMICAAGNGIDSCQGDSGGPLVAGGWLAGVVSWGSGCGNSFYPGVYSSVGLLKDFITSYANVL